MIINHNQDVNSFKCILFLHLREGRELLGSPSGPCVWHGNLCFFRYVRDIKDVKKWILFDIKNFEYYNYFNNSNCLFNLHLSVFQKWRS